MRTSRPHPRIAQRAAESVVTTPSAVEPLEGRIVFASAPPTNAEQLLIELINRARANPTQYAVDVSLDAALLDAVPQPPLAVNPVLTSAARTHAQDMADTPYYAYIDPVTGDGPNEFARAAGYPLASLFSSAHGANNVESIVANTSSAPSALNALLEEKLSDGSVLNPAVHRIQLLAIEPFFQAHDEIGVGKGFNVNAPYQDYWGIMTAFDDAPGKFLTGVVFSDTVATDNFYSIGEGLGSITVTATRAGDGAQFSAVTYASGGYSLRLDPGTYSVSASGTGLTSTLTYPSVVMGGLNVKRDFKANATAPEVRVVQVSRGEVQRSRITTLAVAFTQPVSLDANAITVTGRAGVGAGTVVNVTNPANDSRNFVVTFSGGSTESGSLADGIYDLLVTGSRVHVGTAAAQTMGANSTRAFHRLFSDADGDGDSDNADLFQVRATYNKFSPDAAYRWYFDSDSDGDVDNADIFQIRSRRTITFVYT